MTLIRSIRLTIAPLLTAVALGGCALSHNIDLPSSDPDLGGDGDGDADGSGGSSSATGGMGGGSICNAGGAGGEGISEDPQQPSLPDCENLR